MKPSLVSWLSALLNNLAALFAAGFLLLITTGCIFASPFSRVVHEEDFGAWKYRAETEEDGWTMVHVSYDQSSLEGLKAFIATNEKLGHELSSDRKQPFNSITTFWRPLSVEEFQRLIAESAVPTDRIKSYTFQATSPNGNWWFGGAPQDDELVDEASLNRVLDTRRSKIGGADILGVVSVEISLKPEEYRHLISDSRVAVIDVTQELVKDRLRNTPGVNMSKVSFATGSPYASLERFGLADGGEDGA